MAPAEVKPAAAAADMAMVVAANVSAGGGHVRGPETATEDILEKEEIGEKTAATTTTITVVMIVTGTATGTGDEGLFWARAPDIWVCTAFFSDFDRRRTQIDKVLKRVPLNLCYMFVVFRIIQADKTQSHFKGTTSGDDKPTKSQTISSRSRRKKKKTTTPQSF